MDVNARTLKSLEWDRLKGYLAAECSGVCSREIALQLELHDELSFLELLLTEGEEALRLLTEGVDLAQESLPDLREALKRLAAGAPLGARELLELKLVLQASSRLKILLHNLDQEMFPTLRCKSAELSVLNDIVSAIDGVIDDEAEIKDDASPLLNKLRREVARLNAQIKDELQKIINSPQGDRCLQEPIFTVRNGRPVLPVLANMRQSIEGIVHDSSSTGLTIFVEPKAVVELTNTIRIKEAEIEREIERLLWMLSAMAAGKVDQIDQSFQALVQADFLAARTRLAFKYKGHRVTLSKNNELKLARARHPLLVLQLGDSNKVVANDIVLNADLRTLIITGPNTGGKTVYLKTAGLLCLMLRAGLLLPVAEGSSASIFQGIFADIGDEQSLEQNLSTFSSHMGNIVEITGLAGPSTLVLLDEIGAGTDPREGVILARAILGHLTRSGAFTICSTHYGELKTLAHTETGYANASMEFDERTLTPSYRMHHGIAGNSHAIAVAARLGLPADLIEEAQEGLDNAKQGFEHKIDEVERHLRLLSEREAEFNEKQAELLKQETELKEMSALLEDELRRSRFEAANQFQSDYRRARTLINELTANLQKTPSLARAQQARDRLEAIKKELDWLDPDEYKKAKTKLEPGQAVRVRSLGQTGTLEELVDGNKACVKVGRLRVKVPLSDLEVTKVQTSTGKSARSHVPAMPRSRPSKAIVTQTDPIFVRGSRNTLDLRGQRVDEGLALLERFVDEAYLEQLSPLMIIHGHGTGAMKAAVRDFLHNSLYKSKFRPGEPYEGGDGVTVINFN